MSPEPSPKPGVPHGDRLRIAAGVRLDDPTPWVTVEEAPARAARARREERLFILLHLNGPEARQQAAHLRELLSRTYWEATGSITAALRQAVSAANRHLFQTNLNAANRCTGGLICAVAHADDLFIIQTGPAVAYHSGRTGTVRLTAPEPPRPLGTARIADTRLYHALIEQGDKLLLAAPAPDEKQLTAALARPTPTGAIEALARTSTDTHLSALILHRDGEKSRDGHPSVRPTARLTSRVAPQTRRTIRAPVGLVTAAGKHLATGAATLFHRMLPTAERRPSPSTTTPTPPSPPPPSAPQENRALLMPIALGIPVLLAILVTLAYLTLGAQARYQSVIGQAQEEIALAQAAGDDREAARPHWEKALEHAEAAVAIHPEDPAAIALRNQAQAALDALDGIVRLYPVLLRDFGAGTVPRRLVVHGPLIFILDPAAGWVAQVTLDRSGGGLIESDSPILVQTGQSIGDGEVGHLVDCTWAKSGSGRRTSGLLVLEKGGALVDYDPSWANETGVFQLHRSFLQTPPLTPGPVGSFEGRFYILDRALPQIRRYEPRGDLYPLPPDNYFVAPDQLPRPLAEALDMAIDGNIYLLYEDGTVLKFLSGEPQPFDMSGIPGGIERAAALAVDPDGSGTVYIADRAGRRVLALSPDGTFRRQFRAAEAFDALEALAVDEGSGQIYTISNGRLFVASLP